MRATPENCGHDCGCEFAVRGELCPFGESKAEALAEARAEEGRWG